ncbi:hypothetical protein V6N13_083634 [Hibiscus sabdariffa]
MGRIFKITFKGGRDVMVRRLCELDEELRQVKLSYSDESAQTAYNKKSSIEVDDIVFDFSPLSIEQANSLELEF